MRSFLLLGVVAVVVGAVLYGLYVTLPKNSTDTANDNSTSTSEFIPAPGFFGTSTDAIAPAPVELLPPRTPPAGAKEYRNTTYRFSLFYPEGLGVEEFDEGGGARTIIFQNPERGQGFQIFIVPYAAPQVSMERFKKDQPSGVMQDPHDLKIDGAIATLFTGKDAFLGDTREVWFIRGGYLFEVTTVKALDEWLGNIMLTWKFI